MTKLLPQLKCLSSINVASGVRSLTLVHEQLRVRNCDSITKGDRSETLLVWLKSRLCSAVNVASAAKSKTSGMANIKTLQRPQCCRRGKVKDPGGMATLMSTAEAVHIHQCCQGGKVRDSSKPNVKALKGSQLSQRGQVHDSARR